MKTSIKTVLSIVAITCFSIANGVHAHDLVPPDFRGLPATVFAEFEFETPANPASPIQGDWVEGADGELIFPEMPPLVSFSDGEFVYTQDDEGYWTATDNGVIQISMPNIIDDFPTKYIRVQVTWSFNGPSNPPIMTGVIGEDAEDGPLTDVKVVNRGTRGIGGNMRQSFIDIRVEPNPDWEIIRLGVRAGMSIHQIVVDTISVPLSEHSGADEVEVVEGVPVFGGLRFLQESDDRYFGIRPEPRRGHADSPFPSSDEFPQSDEVGRLSLNATLIARSFWGAEENEVLAVLAFRVETRATAPGVKQTVQLFNWRTNEYDIVGSNWLTMEDVIYEYELLNFADYVEPTTGESIVKLNTRSYNGIPIPNTVLDWIDWKRELGLYGDE